MMSLVWRCGLMVSWSAWPILISKLAVFHLQGEMTYILLMPLTLVGHPYQWLCQTEEGTWVNGKQPEKIREERQQMTNIAWKLLFHKKSYFFSLVLSLKYAGLTWCLLVFLQPDFLLLNYPTFGCLMFSFLEAFLVLLNLFKEEKARLTTSKMQLSFLDDWIKVGLVVLSAVMIF